ncbi:MAG: HlyD family efflux transporter periplasmic adaptor subunit, partial [Clostridia bacterium]|nr:HlyD family efflux transporter periplasmic adaptor subunit [Clostridia bacterium]
MSVKMFRLLAAILAVVAMGTVLSGCALFPTEEEALPPPLIEAVVANYTTYNPEIGTVENLVSGSASVAAISSVNVAFAGNSGLFMGSYFGQGDMVEAGDILAETDNSVLEENLKVAEMQAEIEELKFAEAQEKYENGQLSEVAWKQAELAIYLSRRDINKLREEFSSTQLIAPVSGRITYELAYQKGAAVTAGTTMFTISDTSELVIRYSDKNYTKIPMGAEVLLTYEYNDGTVAEFTATAVQTPDIVPEDSSDKYVVILKSDNMPEEVTVGSRLSLLYVIEKSENTMFIRSASIKNVGDRKYVYILKDGYRQERDIVTGLEGEYVTEVLEGLEVS